MRNSKQNVIKMAFLFGIRDQGMKSAYKDDFDTVLRTNFEGITDIHELQQKYTHANILRRANYIKTSIINACYDNGRMGQSFAFTQHVERNFYLRECVTVIEEECVDLVPEPIFSTLKQYNNKDGLVTAYNQISRVIEAHARLALVELDVEMLDDLVYLFEAEELKSMSVLFSIAQEVEDNKSDYPYGLYFPTLKRDRGFKYLFANDYSFYVRVFQNGAYTPEKVDFMAQLDTPNGAPTLESFNPSNSFSLLSNYKCTQDADKGLDVVREPLQTSVIKEYTLFVDCDNIDFLKFLSFLLNPLSNIKGDIHLYIDQKSGNFWTCLKDILPLKTARFNGYTVVPRVFKRIKDEKSVVDSALSAGMMRYHLENPTKELLLVSSDSDFYGLLASMPVPVSVLVDRADTAMGYIEVLREEKVNLLDINAYTEQHLIDDVLEDVLKYLFIMNILNVPMLKWDVAESIASLKNTFRTDISITKVAHVVDSMKKGFDINISEGNILVKLNDGTQMTLSNTFDK